MTLILPVSLRRGCPNTECLLTSNLPYLREIDTISVSLYYSLLKRGVTLKGKNLLP